MAPDLVTSVSEAVRRQIVTYIIHTTTYTNVCGQTATTTLTHTYDPSARNQTVQTPLGLDSCTTSSSSPTARQTWKAQAQATSHLSNAAKAGIGVGVTVALAVLVALIIIVALCLKRRRARTTSGAAHTLSPDAEKQGHEHMGRQGHSTLPTWKSELAGDGAWVEADDRNPRVLVDELNAVRSPIELSRRIEELNAMRSPSELAARTEELSAIRSPTEL